jgi:hypothetical protein
MIKLKGDLMFDKTIIKILFVGTIWNETHIIYWLNARKIKYINIKLERGIYTVNINKVSKDIILKESELKGENGIYFYYL